MRPFFLLILCALSLSASSQHKPAYKIFSGDTTEISYYAMIDSLVEADVLLFGELHNEAIAHWLQQEVYLDLKNKRTISSVGFEMFETDQQVHLDSFLRDSIDIPEDVAWSNYKTDYKPILELLRQDSVSLVATNIPRRYARMVFNGGFGVLDSLPEEEKAYIPTLPVAYDPELPGYKAMLAMFDHMEGDENFPKAQAIKDATMSHNILKHWQEGELFYHLNGAYHSNDKEGICWYLWQAQPGLKIKTISVVNQSIIDVLEVEYHGKADFIICVPSRMTKTY